MAPTDRISANEVLAAAGAEKPVSGGTFLQRTGLMLAAGVGSLAALITCFLVVRTVSALPATPFIPPGLDQNGVRLLLENYKSLQQIATAPYTSLFDSVVVKVLLPVLTSILG